MVATSGDDEGCLNGAAAEVIENTVDGANLSQVEVVNNDSIQQEIDSGKVKLSYFSASTTTISFNFGVLLTKETEVPVFGLIRINDDFNGGMGRFACFFDQMGEDLMFAGAL